MKVIKILIIFNNIDAQMSNGLLFFPSNNFHGNDDMNYLKNVKISTEVHEVFNILIVLTSVENSKDLCRMKP